MDKILEMRRLLKEGMHEDLSKVLKPNEAIYVVTLQQEVLAFSLDQCLNYYDRTSSLPENVAEMMFRECSIAMREMYPELYGLQAMRAMKPQFDNLSKNILEARLFVQSYYMQLEEGLNQPTSGGGTVITYCSTRHQRIENISSAHPTPWDMSYAQRIIKLHYTNFGKTLTVEMYPTLTPKRATLVSDKNDVLTYFGDDPDYVFEIETKADNTIKRISLFRRDKDVELRYFE